MTDLPLETGTEYKNPGVTNAEYAKGIKKTSQTYWRIDGYPVNTKIYRDYALMHNAALKEGIKLTLVSGFRSPDEQQLLRNNLLLDNITKTVNLCFNKFRYT
jgi:LAS superfamily LD-carboxypeptidase LdcB